MTSTIISSSPIIDFVTQLLNDPSTIALIPIFIAAIVKFREMKDKKLILQQKKSVLDDASHMRIELRHEIDRLLAFNQKLLDEVELWKQKYWDMRELCDGDQDRIQELHEIIETSIQKINDLNLEASGSQAKITQMEVMLSDEKQQLDNLENILETIQLKFRSF